MAGREILTRLPAVVGPTASGKTSLAIAVGRRLGCEIISCDSMQIYREMDIGTAKPTAAERAALPHHLLDFLPPGTPYSAADYAADAYRTVEEILSRGRLPLFCGGTGLYLEAAARGGEEQETIPGATAIRASLQKEANEQGADALWQRLQEVDPAAAAATHKNNTRRVIRALEVYLATGVPKTEWDARTRRRPPVLSVVPLMLTYPDRTLLYRRIDERVALMLQSGLVEEARGLYERGLLSPGTTAAQAIGYKELLPHLAGTCARQTAVEALCLATRHYAKRQLTWFAHMPGLLSLSAVDETGAPRTVDDLADEAVRLFAAAGVAAP